MATFEQGETLPCGCVVGHYWCGLHDIGARRSKDSYTWGFGPGDTFVWKIMKANAHRPISDFMPIRSERDYYGSGDGSCSCHIMAPCSYCVSGGDDDE